ncbi:hypothetical protein EMPS_07276 [Entomortierella parvispora]|uniref:Major facilitator superfamily (MFS) profile domain-containing protein n=1 Tax=Entomortierella parvispora TaxID=205924 RepID=A0A9P3LYA5_9FUNG|nr:hypothetical protein EMPS_07276 [Entomortierella parvispora]
MPSTADPSRPGQPHQSISVRTSSPPPAMPPPPMRSLSPEELLAQTSLLDNLMDDIGMGKFQKQLMFLCGLGWFADNMWMQCIALILPRVQDQFEIQDKYIGILSSSMFVGMMFGAMFWGMLADAYGRKQAFNFTLIVTTFFGIAASFANSYWLLCLLILGLGFGVGGNMPVDGALFLEFTPKKNQYLLTFLSIFFSFGAVATSLLGYFLLPPFSCETHVEGGCRGRGWRYMLLALGGLTLSMVVGRVILFRLEESPKFLLNHNRHQEAAVVLCRIFEINHKEPQSDNFEENIEALTTRFQQPDTGIYSGEESSSSESESSDAGTSPTEFGNMRRVPTSDPDSALSRHRRLGSNQTGGPHSHEPGTRPSYFARQRRHWKHKWNTALRRLEPLLAPKFRLSTILIWIIWALVAFAYTAFNVFYPKFLQEHGQTGNESLKQVYQDMIVYSLSGVPGSVLATYMVETFLGRRYTMAVSTFGTALSVILFAFLSSHTVSVVVSAILSLLSTLNYAVIYSYTPEVFPSEIRGTACGVAAAMSRLAGIVSPLIVGAMLTVNTSFPLYASALTFLISGICMVFLPIETRGRAAT